MENCIKKDCKSIISTIAYKGNLSNQSFIWQIQDNDSRFFLVKALFSIVNIAPIWNHQVCKEAITTQEALERLLFCNHSKVCISAQASSNGRYVIMRQANPKCFRIISLEEFKEIASLCYQFNLTNFDRKRFNNLKPFWMNGNLIDTYHIIKEIVDPFTATSEIFLNFINDNNNEIQKLLFEARKIDNYNSVNYDNSIIDHLVIENNKLSLLPSRYTYVGPLGMDAGQLCIEYCLTMPYDKIILLQIVTILSEIYHMRQKDIMIYIKTNILLLLRKRTHLKLYTDSLFKLWNDIKDINIP